MYEHTVFGMSQYFVIKPTQKLDIKIYTDMPVFPMSTQM